MKISLNWVFDHIKNELSNVDVPALVEKFIRTTAEIEGFKHVGVNTSELTLAQVKHITGDMITVYSPEHNREYTLPKRADASSSLWFMVVDTGVAPRWATSVIFGGVKDMMLPAIHCSEDMQDGSWKETIEHKDYVIEVDNKSINSRPDLWSHRGLAREIAAILNLSLRPLQEFLAESFDTSYFAQGFVGHSLLRQGFVGHAGRAGFFSVAINKAPEACDRFAALYLPSVAAQPSHLDMVVRLSRLDSRCINFLVDATNYVMLDIGQPMHAFDADTFTTREISVAYAHDKEKLALLDGETIELTSQDVVITNDGKAISLAGIMGGAITAISNATRSVLLEAAHFDPVIIRRTAARHKKRSESSTRFEKNIDPNHNADAIKRYLFLLNKAGIAYTADEKIISLGNFAEQKIVTVRHAFIEERLGVLIKPEHIADILTKLEFGVEQSVENDTLSYIITVPTFRATKDVKIPEDIVEEVGRYIGYDMLPRVMPSLPLSPHDLHTTYTTRAIKRFLSYGLEMRELYGYSFFDESVLRQLKWQPCTFVEIKNPISENYTRMVTTLQPNMLKAIGENSIAHQELRFYEWGRVWHTQGENVVEQKSLSGVFFSCVKETIDFYGGKAMLSRLFDELYMHVLWQPIENNKYSWSSGYHTAQLVHEGTVIGTAGMVDQTMVNELSSAGGSIFIFEINGDYLLDYRRPLKRFNPLSKYPSVRRDVSIMIGASITADALIDSIKASDRRIASVSLIDFFSKPEWKDQKSMTFHVEIEDKEKTLTAQEIDSIYNRVVGQLQQLGAVIR